MPNLINPLSFFHNEPPVNDVIGPCTCNYGLGLVDI